MRRHHDWSTPGFELPPFASAVGPFAGRAFLAAASRLESDEVVIYESDDALFGLVIGDRVVTAAGDADLTDYHSPLGSNVAELIEEIMSDLPSGMMVSFDSLPLEAAEAIAAGMERWGADVDVDEHTVAAVLSLPETFDEYLHMIGKKQRHEVRRKRRRYEEAVGELVHERHHGPGWAFDEFARLHRQSAGAKGDFLTPARERFFGELVETDGWRIDVLRVPDTDDAAACLFSFSDGEGYYLYNSAYDPDLSDASPGVAILGSMIERAISEGIGRFDFLKGDEVYKFRLGAEERPLFRVRART